MQCKKKKGIEVHYRHNRLDWKIFPDALNLKKLAVYLFKMEKPARQQKLAV